MILQSLCDYYRRQTDELPPPGFERKAIPFVIVLNRDGQFVDIEDTRSDSNNKRDKGRLFTVPQALKKHLELPLTCYGTLWVMCWVQSARYGPLN